MEKAESCPIKRCLQSYCVAVALQRYIAIIVGGKKSIYSSFFTEEDRKKWLDAGNLNLIELSSENTSEIVKSGLELYGFGRGW